MTLNGRNTGGISGDAERDARFDRLYREAGGDTPPARLDAAILAAAHREVGARPRPLSSTLRRWRVPVSIAAVVVLSVSLVTLVEEEGGDRFTEIPPVAPRPALQQEASPPGPAATAEAGREDRSAQRQPERTAAPAASTLAPTAPPSRPTAPVEARPAPADAAGGRALGPFPGRRQEQQPPAAAVVPQPRAGTPVLPDLLSKPAPAPSARARDKMAVDIRGMAAESPSSLEARRPITEAAQAPASPAAAKEVAAAIAGRVMSSAPPAPVQPAAKPVPKAAVSDQGRSMEAGGGAVLQRPPIWSDLERQPPEKWLERIEELRRAGRTAESNELLTEFRKRFPDHSLPAWVR